MFSTLANTMTLPIEAAWLGMEAQAVIALRMAGLAGLWHAAPDEMSRMVTEKQRASVDAGEAATRAFMQGAGADQAMRAVVQVYSRHTAGNLRRLAKLGPAYLG
ncbi:antifreeze protein [Rhodobacteraceae bacterium]|nr:antifreeze protein [Paracoccaceae bacterium]